MIYIVIDIVLAFFYQILYTSIVATVIGGVILMLKKVIRKRLSPNANYIIWLVFLVALTFPISLPSRVSIYNLININDVKYSINKELDRGIKLWRRESSRDRVNSTIENNCRAWINYMKLTVALTWFIGFIRKLVKDMRSYFSISELAENGIVTDERIIAILEEGKKRLKIRRNIKLVQHDMISTPSTIGVFNVKIMVSNSLFELDNIALLNIFMHELSHYKRRDNVVNFIILILRALHWFNPFLKRMIKSIRDDMEFATDALAFSRMKLEEQKSYNKTLLTVAAMYCVKDEPVLLGLSGPAGVLENRVDMVLLKEKFEENSRIILMSTIFIVLLMCSVLYPSSYGMFDIPKLYLKLENGDKIEAVRVENDDISGINEIVVSENSKVDLVVKGGRPDDYIFYNKMDLEMMSVDERTASVLKDEILDFENGEYIYNFVIIYGKNQTANYAMKIIVK